MKLSVGIVEVARTVAKFQLGCVPNFEQEEIKMHRGKLAKRLLVVSALSTIIIPLGVDAVLLAKGHMNNPAWLPHAKLHCAMSFFAAISLLRCCFGSFAGSSGYGSLLDGPCRVSRISVLGGANCCWFLARNFLRVSKRSGSRQYS